MIKEGCDSLNRRGYNSEHHLVVAKLWLKLGKYNADNSKAASRHNIEGLPTLRVRYIVLGKDEEQQQSMREVWKVPHDIFERREETILDDWKGFHFLMVVRVPDLKSGDRGLKIRSRVQLPLE